MSVLAIDRLTDRSHGQHIAPALAEARHQIHSGVDNSPGDIATERSEQHRPYCEAIGRRDADRARDGQGHYQTEQDFGEPFDRLKHPAGQSHKMSPQFVALRARRCASKHLNGSTQNTERAETLGANCLAPKMSALGQKQTFAVQKGTSALPPIATAKADFRKRPWNAPPPS